MAKNMAKRSFFVSLTSLGLSAAMMVGTTFAWFTDTATSGGNIIQTGKLDVKMSYSTEIGGTYLDVEAKNTPPVFNYTNWEPGYSDVKYVKIENEGTLAFKYALDIVPMMLMADGEVDLADVIDVSVAVADGAATDKGTLSKIFEDQTSIAEGVLYSDTVAAENATDDKVDEIIYRVTMKMKTSAGREYMGLNVGDGFDLRLYATQYTYEKDSLGDQYDKDADFEKLPVAKVYKMTPPTVTNTDNESVVLDTAYEFKTPETAEEAKNSPYRYYHADFVVTFDKDIAANSLGLAGQYDTFSLDWLAFDIPEDIEADESIRLLKDGPQMLGINQPIVMNYAEICEFVKEFSCGAYNNSLANVGKTMTVELRLYETEEPSAENGNSTNVETGNYEVIGSYTYTFGHDEAPVAAITELNAAEVNEGNAIAVRDINNIANTTGKEVTLNVAYEFVAPHTKENVAESDWADWHCDYVVSLNADLEKGAGGLAGCYDPYGWIAFDIPENVIKDKEYALLGSVTKNPWTYEDVVTRVGTFQCGAYANDATKMSGITMTVILRLTNPNNSAEFVDISTITYTFA